MIRLTMVANYCFKLVDDMLGLIFELTEFLIVITIILQNF